MEKSFAFLDRNIEVSFATVENGRPRLRVFQIMKREGTTLYFATSTKKSVYTQLRENPNVEIMGYDRNEFVRLSGIAIFDVNDSTAKEIYDTNPVLSRLYKDYRNLVYFRIEPQEMEYYDLTPTPPKSEYHDFRKR